MIKTLVWASEEKIIEAYDLNSISQNVSVLISDVKNTSFKKLIKEMKVNDTDRILKIKNDYSFELIFKRNSVWTTIKFEDLVSYVFISKKYKVSNNDSFIPKKIRTGKTELDITFPFFPNKKVGDYKLILANILDNDFFPNIKESMPGNTLYVRSSRFKLDNDDLFTSFVDNIQNKKLAGIEKIDSTFSEGILKINTKYGDINIFKEGDFYIISSFLKCKDSAISNLHSYSRGMMINLKNHLTNNMVETNKPKKIRKRDITTWIISLAVVTLLLFATFNFIFSPHNLNVSMKIIFSGYSWTHPWLYFMITNFIISLFIGPIVGMIIFKATRPKEKLRWNKIGHFFVSGQIRLVTVFLTGNSILATFVWAWYLTSTIKVKTVGLVGMIASSGILRGIILLPIGSLFMIRGSFFNSTILTELGMKDELAAIVTLSWIGWIWHIIHNLSISLLIVLPPLHILWNKITLLRYSREGNTEKIIDKMNNFEMNLISLKHSFKNVFKKRKKMTRITSLILINIVIETFEFTFGLRMVEGYAYNEGIINSVGNYWNIFAISSVRYMSGFVYHVPIINLIPGQGAGITDLTLKISTEGVIGHAHNWTEISSNDLSDLSEQTTFLMRFFNFYLRRIIALVLTTIFIGRFLMKKGYKNG